MSRVYPVRARRPRSDHQQLRAQREVRRRRAVTDVVVELGEEATHGEVARRTGIPEGYLRWAYPSLVALLSAPA